MSDFLGIRSFPTKQGLWLLWPEQPTRWQQIYPSIDVELELGKAWAWLDANPTRQKTHRGMPKFLNGWLNRASVQHSSRRIAVPYRPRAQRQAVCPHTPPCLSPGNWQCQQRTVLEEARRG